MVDGCFGRNKFAVTSGRVEHLVSERDDVDRLMENRKNVGKEGSGKGNGEKWWWWRIKRDTSRVCLSTFQLPLTTLTLPPMDVPHKPQCMVCFRKFQEERHMLSHQTQSKYCRDALALEELNGHLDAFAADMDDFDQLKDDPPNADDDVDEDNIDFNELMDDFLVSQQRPPTPNPFPQPAIPIPSIPPTPKSRTPPTGTDIDTFSGAGCILR